MKLTPAFEQLAGEYSVKCKALKFFGVNTQMAPDLASQFESTFHSDPFKLFKFNDIEYNRGCPG